MARGATLRLVAGMAIGVALLVGCAEEQPASDTLPTASAEAEPSDAGLPPLGPAEFPVPPEAREKTPQGALEFAKYYMGLGTEIGAGTVAAQSLRDLSQECALCEQIADSYEADQSAGYTYRGAKSTFEEYGLPQLSGSTAEVGFVYTQSAYTVIDATGNAITDRAGEESGALQSGMNLLWRDDLHSWVVTSLTVG